MHRIDSVGATVDNNFKATPAPATRVSPEWLTAVQEELANVVELFGIEGLNKGDNAQVHRAIYTVMTNAIAAEVDARNAAIDYSVALEAAARNDAIAAGDAAEATARNTAIGTAVSAEATARDTAIDTAVSAEATARDTAIGIAVGTEATARADGDTATLTSANTYTDGKFGMIDSNSGFQIGPMVIKTGNAIEGYNAFASSFPNACLFVGTQLINDIGSGDESDEFVRVTAKDVDGFTITITGDHSTYAGYYLAIGY